MIAIGLLFIRMLCDCFKPRQQSPEGPPLREMNPRALNRFHCPFQDGLEKCVPPY
jgi:hypothetical protein